MAIYSGFFHSKWWFSIAMLNYQRVIESVVWLCLKAISPQHVAMKSGETYDQPWNGKVFMEYPNCQLYHTHWWVRVKKIEPFENRKVADGKNDLLSLRVFSHKQPAISRWNTTRASQLKFRINLQLQENIPFDTSWWMRSWKGRSSNFGTWELSS